MLIQARNHETFPITQWWLIGNKVFVANTNTTTTTTTIPGTGPPSADKLKKIAGKVDSLSPSTN